MSNSESEVRLAIIIGEFGTLSTDGGLYPGGYEGRLRLLRRLGLRFSLKFDVAGVSEDLLETLLRALLFPRRPTYCGDGERPISMAKNSEVGGV